MNRRQFLQYIIVGIAATAADAALASPFDFFKSKSARQRKKDIDMCANRVSSLWHTLQERDTASPDEAEWPDGFSDGISGTFG